MPWRLRASSIAGSLAVISAILEGFFPFPEAAVVAEISCSIFLSESETNTLFAHSVNSFLYIL